MCFCCVEAALTQQPLWPLKDSSRRALCQLHGGVLSECRGQRYKHRGGPGHICNNCRNVREGHVKQSEPLAEPAEPKRSHKKKRVEPLPDAAAAAASSSVAPPPRSHRAKAAQVTADDDVMLLLQLKEATRAAEKKRKKRS